MSYDADLAIVYACALAVFGSLIVWIVPAAFLAVSESVSRALSDRRRQLRGDGPPAPRRVRSFARLPGAQGAP
jgi:hypothetical protein